MSDKLKVTSVSLPVEAAKELTLMAADVHESTALILRQVVRVALARGWTAETLKLTNSRPNDAERTILRLALSEAVLEQFKKKAGDVGVSRFAMGCCDRFLALRELGDRSLLDLDQR